MDIMKIIESLRSKRPIYHSEADFQFTLAWEIQVHYPDALVRIEYPAPYNPNKYIDVVVWIGQNIYPIELKYKTKKLEVISSGEKYYLKNHGAQDLGNYDYIKDICRLEEFSEKMDYFREGFAIWLTNDQFYWNEPRNPNVGYLQFSVHNKSIIEGSLSWGPSMGQGSTRGRDEVLTLKNRYEVSWNDYSDLGIPDGILRYALLKVTK
jgi:hypothetical protein